MPKMAKGTHLDIVVKAFHHSGLTFRGRGSHAHSGVRFSPYMTVTLDCPYVQLGTVTCGSDAHPYMTVSDSPYVFGTGHLRKVCKEVKAKQGAAARG